MPNRSSHFSKTKSSKKLTSYKASGSFVSSSLYSGVPSAKWAIQNSGSTFSIPDELDGIFGSDDLPALEVQYHPWESKYNQIFTREKIKKSMTKDSYTGKKYSINHANESITTEEECEPELLPFDAIRIDKPVIRQKAKSVAPNMVRQVRYYNVTQSERFLPPISTRKSSISQLQVETKTSLPMIGTNKKNLATTNRLLRRIKLRNDASAIQRPPRELSIEPIHETIKPLAVFA